MTYFRPTSDSDSHHTRTRALVRPSAPRPPTHRPAPTTDPPYPPQFSAKHEQKLDCGGGYIKLLPSTADVESFGGDTPYAIMFGPDICGHATRRVHVILANKGDAKPANLLIKDDIRAESDQLTHVYTLIIYPNNSYVVKIDGSEVSTGAIEDRWDFLPPKTIKDPAASKPEDWDDRPVIPDPNDVKPDDWDELNPEFIDDVDAKKPDDWDDEEDGEWQTPTTRNPEYKGPWTQKSIANPAYKGQWEHPTIPNPDYDATGADELYKFDDLRYVGFELWQVKAGTIFDNVLVTDDPAYAERFANETWGATRDAERKMFDAVEKARAAKEAEEARKVTDADLEADKRAQPITVTNDDDDDDDDADDEYREEPAHDEL